MQAQRTHVGARQKKFGMMNANRRQTFKAPPTSESLSQQARREKALEEQRRKRSQQIDSVRNLDAFSNLSIDAENDDDGDGDGPTIVREGVGHLTSLLPPPPPPPSTSSDASGANQSQMIADPSKKLRKPNARYANKIMYAELLEMRDDDELLLDGERMDDRDDAAGAGAGVGDDGIPSDLDTNWVALGPVPKGKRCLAVSNQTSNIPGRVSNALLKSRLMGRTILSFPSPLPPLTIIDCILDENWRTNGILHVLDVIRWKGQNIGECEANFRFWWRNTRIEELEFLNPVMPIKPKPESTATGAGQFPSSSKPHIFAYPVTFLPVPYYLDLSYPSLLSTIIPSSRSTRHIPITLPYAFSSNNETDEMEVEVEVDRHPSTSTAEIESDGLLLYVSQASYECGTSPLSTWVPLVSYTPGKPSPLVVFEKLITRRMRNIQKS